MVMFSDHLQNWLYIFVMTCWGSKCWHNLRNATTIVFTIVILRIEGTAMIAKSHYPEQKSRLCFPIIGSLKKECILFSCRVVSYPAVFLSVPILVEPIELELKQIGCVVARRPFTIDNSVCSTHLILHSRIFYSPLNFSPWIFQGVQLIVFVVFDAMVVTIAPCAPVPFYSSVINDTWPGV